MGEKPPGRPKSIENHRLIKHRRVFERGSNELMVKNPGDFHPRICNVDLAAALPVSFRTRTREGMGIDKLEKVYATGRNMKYDMMYIHSIYVYIHTLYTYITIYIYVHMYIYIHIFLYIFVDFDTHSRYTWILTHLEPNWPFFGRLALHRLTGWILLDQQMSDWDGSILKDIFTTLTTHEQMVGSWIKSQGRLNMISWIMYCFLLIYIYAHPCLDSLCTPADDTFNIQQRRFQYFKMTAMAPLWFI